MLSPHAMRSEVKDRWTAPVVGVLAALLAWQLLVPPVVGLADQGDFYRLWGWFGIDAITTDPEQRYFRYLIREWRIDPRDAKSSGFFSADLIFVGAAVALNALVSDPGVFDIRTLGAVRAVALLFCAYLLMRVARHGGAPMQALAGLALLFVVADAGYIAYFNSGFTEPGSLIFTLSTIALYVRLAVGEGNRGANAVAFALSCLLLIWSKPQNVVLAVPLALLAWRALATVGNRRWRFAAAACSVALLASSALYSALPPPLWYQQHVRHIAVFNSALLESGDPARDLRELGVDPRWAFLRGSFPWDEIVVRNAEALQREFHDRVDNATIAGFFARHPGRAVGLLKRSAHASLAVRVGLGQFEASSGRPPFARARWFALRSDFVERFGPHRFRWIVAILGLSVAVAALAWGRAQTRTQRLLAEGVLILALAAVAQYTVVALLQGPVAVSKGMMLFAFLYDATVVCSVAIVVHGLVRRYGTSTDKG
jgi:hypothetical protein